MDRSFIREKIVDLAILEKCEITTADIDYLETVWRKGHATPMPGWVFAQLPTNTLEDKVFKLGVLTSKMQVRAALLPGRTKIRD
jgi:hypothetical protein